MPSAPLPPTSPIVPLAVATGSGAAAPVTTRCQIQRPPPTSQPNRSIGGCHRLGRSRRCTDRLRMPSTSLKPYLVNEIVYTPIDNMRLVLQYETRRVSSCGLRLGSRCEI